MLSVRSISDNSELPVTNYCRYKSAVGLVSSSGSALNGFYFSCLIFNLFVYKVFMFFSESLYSYDSEMRTDAFSRYLLSVIVSYFHYYNLICVYGCYCTVTVITKDTVTNKIRATAFSVLLTQN